MTELGYSLSHAFGAVFDNPGLIVACAIGDGKAETGPLATAWHSTKFLSPIGDGAVLPILHLNGYKISNPTVLARIEHEELDQFLRGCGWAPHYVEGDDPWPTNSSNTPCTSTPTAKTYPKSATGPGTLRK
jgi:xylulose-5-phosphate/fructose-6-phosphate phosphoketolase